MSKVFTEDELKGFQAEVRKETGLNWELIEANYAGNTISYQLLIPVSGQRVRAYAYSTVETPTILYSINVDCQAATFMELLRKLAPAA